MSSYAPPLHFERRDVKQVIEMLIEQRNSDEQRIAELEAEATRLRSEVAELIPNRPNGQPRWSVALVKGAFHINVKVFFDGMAEHSNLVKACETRLKNSVSRIMSETMKAVARAAASSPPKTSSFSLPTYSEERRPPFSNPWNHVDELDVDNLLEPSRDD